MYANLIYSVRRGKNFSLLIAFVLLSMANFYGVIKGFKVGLKLRSISPSATAFHFFHFLIILLNILANRSKCHESTNRYLLPTVIYCTIVYNNISSLIIHKIVKSVKDKTRD